MTPEIALQNFETVAQQYLADLERYTAEDFTRKPDDAQWSVGQVYMHVTGGAFGFHLRNAGLCSSGEAPETDETTDNARGLFEAGSFPTMRIAVPPSPQYTPPQPESIDAARTMLRQLVVTMRETAPRVADADPRRKLPHPFYGPLNAQEWYRLVEMHFRHHLMQKARLEEWLAGQGQEAAA